MFNQNDCKMKNGIKSRQAKSVHRVNGNLITDAIFNTLSLDPGQQALIDFKQAVLILGNVTPARLYYT
jgi:hypothetical protein